MANPRLIFNLPPEQRRRLERKARELNVPLASVIRMGIEAATAVPPRRANGQDQPDDAP